MQSAKLILEMLCFKANPAKSAILPYQSADGASKLLKMLKESAVLVTAGERLQIPQASNRLQRDN
jgi:hypothetical protein